MYLTGLRILHVLMLLALLGGCAHPVPSTRELQSKFAQVAPATRLHFIDFGGKGEPVILLAGPGNTAWIYAAFGKDLANVPWVFHMVGSNELRRQSAQQSKTTGKPLYYRGAQPASRNSGRG